MKHLFMQYSVLVMLCSVLAFSAYADEPIVTPDGAQLYVEVRGEGPPALYIHGGPGSGSYWLQKFSGPLLEQRFQMIYLDQRGVARSTSPVGGDFSLQRMVQDFEQIRQHLGIKQWYTLGHSFGGTMQMAYVQAHPDSHLGMIMLNTTLDLNESFQAAMPKIFELLGLEEPAPLASDKQTPFERIMPYLHQLREKDLFWKMQYLDKANETAMNATFNEVPNWNWDFGNAAMSIAEYQQNFKPGTAEVQVPVLFFYGKQDWMVGPEHYRGVNFPKLLLWESPAGHVPFMEDEEGLTQAIDAFLAQHKEH